MSTVSAPAVSQAAHAVPVRWSAWTRLGFRCAFLYFVWFLFAQGSGLLAEFGYVPLLERPVGWLNDALAWPFTHAALWTATHVVHLRGVAATFHPVGSGDTAMDWMMQGVGLVFAVVGGLVWTGVAAARGSERRQYSTMYAWLRFLLRLTCGMYMLSYGFHKVFPLQMREISLTVLNEPVGQSSPMTLLWSLIGLHPVYEVICGLAEVLGGVLILFRRTALLGALISAFVMVNVVLYNLFFDVPVKLFATNLLVALVFITLPDWVPLYRFFWQHRPAAPVGIWIPPAERRGFRVATRTIELVFVFGLMLVNGVSEGMSWREHLHKVGTPSPLTGVWRLDPGSAPNALLQGVDGTPVTELSVDNPDRGYRRATDGTLWRVTFTVDNAAHTVVMRDTDTGETTKYNWRIDGGDHLLLVPVVEKGSGKTAGAATLTRVATPAHYPLLDRGFHMVNEWGLER